MQPFSPKHDYFSFGTMGFREPTIDAPVTEKADLWSLGAVMYCLLASSSNIMGWAFGDESPRREQMYAYWTQKLFTYCGNVPGGIEIPRPAASAGQTGPRDLWPDAQPLISAWLDGMRAYVDGPAIAPMYEFYRPHDFTPSLPAADLLCKMLRQKASDRISASDALDHPWFDDAQDDQAFNALVRDCSRLYGEAMEETLLAAREAGDDLDGMEAGDEIDMAGIVKIHVPPRTPNGSTIEGQVLFPDVGGDGGGSGATPMDDDDG